MHSRQRTFWRFLMGSIALACAGSVPAQEEKPATPAPAVGEFGEKVGPGDSDKGGKLYSRYCRGCHGEEGKGDGLVFMPHANNLSRKGYIDKLPDEYLLFAIAKGGEGIGKSSYMPAWEGTLQKQDMFDLIAYIRSLPLN